MEHCKCNNPDPLACHECEESTGVCYCKCHDHKQVGEATTQGKPIGTFKPAPSFQPPETCPECLAGVPFDAKGHHVRRIGEGRM